MSDDAFIDLDQTDFGPTMKGHQPGERLFSRYVLKRHLGQGGMGVVWLAHDERLGQEVALKFAPDAVRFDPVAIEELKEETRKGLQLAHPHIVRIHDFCEDEKHAAISMEYVDGETLAKLRAARPGKVFEPSEVEHWMRQLVDGMSYAHRSARIVHRDLKPPNLLINRQGNLKIMDFGIARSMEDSLMRVTVAGTSKGTLPYMSPQQIGGSAASFSDDVYAFGSTLYELFTGKPPFFRGDVSHQILDQAVPAVEERRREFQILDRPPFPALWEELIQRCLAKSPAERPADFEAIQRFMGWAGTGGSTSAHFGELPPTVAGRVGDGAATGTGFGLGLGTAAGATAGRTGGGLTLLGTEAVSGRPGTGTAGNRASGSPPPLPFGDAASVAGQGGGIRKGEGRSDVARAALFVLGLLGAVALLGAGVWYGWSATQTRLSEKRVASCEGGARHAEQNGVASTEKGSRAGSQTVTSTTGVAVQTLTETPPAGGEAMKSAAPRPLSVPDGYATLAEALAAAKPGETVRLGPGEFEAGLELPDGVSLEAKEAGRSVLRSEPGKGPVLTVDSSQTPVSLTGLVFAHTGEGAQTGGSALVHVLGGEVTLEKCVFEKGVGNGLDLVGAGKLVVRDCEARQNSGHGFFCRNATVTFERCKAHLNGGDGLCGFGVGTVVQAVDLGLTRNGGNGLIVEDGARVTVRGQQSQSSENVRNGVAVVVSSEPGTTAGLDWEGGSIRDNGVIYEGATRRATGKDGIGVFAGPADLASKPANPGRAVVRLSGVTVSGNQSHGVALFDAFQDCRLENCQLTRNAKAGLAADGTAACGLELRGCEISRNGQQGVLLVGQGFAARVMDSQIQDNATYGVAIVGGAIPEVTGNRISGNVAGPLDRVEAGPGARIQEEPLSAPPASSGS